jgi:4-hydroxythreonine-4-phosphate dehydrogenase
MQDSPALPLAMSMGEPAGIGPEIALAAWEILRAGGGPVFFVIGSPGLFRGRARRAGMDVPVVEIMAAEDAVAAFAEGLPILALKGAEDLPDNPGMPVAETAAAVTGAIEAAVSLTLGGQAAGIVTLPIQKETLYAAGFAHEGHTDFLAHLARRAGYEATPVMMLTAADLRCVPVTVHVALADVPARLAMADIVAQGRIVARDLERLFGIRSPRIAVAGLNPHAGEGGRMGREEETVIAPAIAALREEGIDAFGPLPADTMFHAEARAGYDAALCMYHDQALIPVKTLDFHGGVNVTLGLPFVRTSPDHGTALRLAGSGRARPDSLINALRLAARMAKAAAMDQPAA